MSRLIVARHGESEANRDRRFATSGEVALTALGRRQAHDLAREVAAHYTPERVVASTFRRAAETAEIVAAHLGLPLDVAPGIHERDLGALKGEPYEVLAALTREDPAFDPAARWLWRPPGGESLDDVRRRVTTALGALAARHPGAELLVVSHGAVMLSLWAHATGSWDGAPLLANCGILPLACTPPDTLILLAPAAPSTLATPASGRDDDVLAG